MVDYFSKPCFPLFGAIWQRYLDCINEQTFLGPRGVAERARAPGILASEKRVSSFRVHNSFRLGACGAGIHLPCSCSEHLLPQEGLSGDAPLFSGQEEGGGREDGWFQSQEINLHPQPSLSIHLAY